MTNTEQLHYANGKCDLLHRVSFENMKPSLHGNHLFSGECSIDQFAFVKFHSRKWEQRNVCIINLCFFFNSHRKIAEPSTEDYSNRRSFQPFQIQEGNNRICWLVRH